MDKDITFGKDTQCMYQEQLLRCKGKTMDLGIREHFTHVNVFPLRARTKYCSAHMEVYSGIMDCNLRTKFSNFQVTQQEIDKMDALYKYHFSSDKNSFIDKVIEIENFKI